MKKIRDWTAEEFFGCSAVLSWFMLPLAYAGVKLDSDFLLLLSVLVTVPALLFILTFLGFIAFEILKSLAGVRFKKVEFKELNHYLRASWELIRELASLLGNKNVLGYIAVVGTPTAALFYWDKDKHPFWDGKAIGILVIAAGFGLFYFWQIVKFSVESEREREQERKEKEITRQP